MWSFLPLVENEIRRGAFYMRPRKYAPPRTGTGGYGIRPYVESGQRRVTWLCPFAAALYKKLCAVPLDIPRSGVILVKYANEKLESEQFEI